jgi:predicted TIM-barrel fold metal-dependent hydrolase
MAEKLWANSGDSHFVEPPDLFDKTLPKDMAERMPRSVKDLDGEYETVTVDGQSFRRKMPRMDSGGRHPGLTAEESLDEKRREGGDLTRGAAGKGWDVEGRLADLNGEGVWGELAFPSLGIWSFNIRDPKLAVAGCQVMNDWSADIQRQSPRIVATASLPLLEVDDTIAEVKRASGMGFKAGFLPVRPSFDGPGWASDHWDPLWDAFAETGMVIAFHIGTEPHTPDQRTGVYHTGRGGAVMNYTETTFGGQRAVCQMIASGALDTRPDLKVIVSEGGSGWIPFIADRLDEAYRQHSAAVRPRLTRPPGEILYSQVYASFQHDYRSSVLAMTGAGFRNTVWGSDYPHFEGTFGHTQKTLHELFDDVPPDVSHRMRIGAFLELFPHVPQPPPDGTEPR